MVAKRSEDPMILKKLAQDKDGLVRRAAANRLGVSATTTVAAGRVCYPWVMVGEFEDGFRKEQGGNDIGDCLSRLQDLESRHGELTWYGGLYDEDYVDGEYVGEENKVLSASSITASDDNIIQMLKDNAETMLDIYYVPEAEADGFDTSNLTIGTPKITYQDEYMINADVPITGPNGVFNLQAELNDEDGEGNYVELLSTYDRGLAYGIIEELGDYYDFRKILNQA